MARRQQPLHNATAHNPQADKAKISHLSRLSGSQ
jgi:hypothetical protein